MNCPTNRTKNLFIFLLLLFSYDLHAESVTATSNATTLVTSLQGSGVIVSGEVLTATAAPQSGTFTGFNFLTENLMDAGVLLSTGTATDLVNGPPTTNTADDSGVEFNTSAVNDADLGNGIYDPVKLSFNVIPQYDRLIIDFLFGSEEYTEYVNGGYNDKMRILVNGVDCALTPDGQQISIDSVNSTVNSSLFKNNDLNDGGANYATEMDGFTRVLTCRANVTPNASIPIVIGLSDEGDAAFDSWALFRAQSLRSEPSSDFGDAPDTYATLDASSGARHTIVEGVYLGTAPTGDADGFREGTDDSGGTAADDTHDDGVGSFPALTDVTTSYSLSVSATSINGNASNLIGWIDFDGDGSFQADEASNVAAVASGTFESPIVLTWNNIGTTGPDIALGNTFARLRITNSAITATNPGGSFATGEVEDFALTITDGVPPVVTTTSAATATAANQTSYPVSGTCTAGDGNVTVSIAGATPASQGVVCSGGGVWSASFDVSAIGDGPNVIDVNASQTDAASNTGNATLVEANKDATAPTLSTTSAATATAANQASYPVSGTCTVGDGNVTVSIAGATPASQGVACSGGGAWSASFDVSAIGDGANVIDVQASQTDAAGNTGNATLVEANKDATAPMLSTTSAATATAANQTSYSVSGTCTAGDGNVTVSIAGAAPASQDVACSGSGAWSASFDVSAIGDGANVIDINASQTDAAGNTGNAVLLAASKDTVGPSIVIQNAPTSFSNLAPFNVTFEFSDNVTGFVSGGITLGNGAVNNFKALDGNTYTADITPNGVGDVTINVAADVAQDAEGNGNTAAIQVTSTRVTDTDIDFDNDGIPDTIECPSGPPFTALTCAGDDMDGDGTPDFQDTDADADAIPDSVEAGSDPNNPVDSDNDGIADFLDLDSDDDAIPDSVEAGSEPNNPLDTDSDGIADYLDLDSDNDALFDLIESGATLTGLDGDNDGRIDLGNAFGSNGLANALETTADSGSVDYTLRDSDSDAVADFRDLDSDNDGIPDVTEAGGSDPDGDGIVGAGMPEVDLQGVTPAPRVPGDVDRDGATNQLDLDADGDGLLDIVEAGGVDSDNDGRVDGFSDTDGDGLDDMIAATPLPLPDNDDDGIPDFLDNDDQDNDGVPDSVDLDLDNDGIANDIEGNGTIDTDNDGVPDSRDLDSDNDGIHDLMESGADAATLDINGDGRIDGSWPVGVNGLADAVESSLDSGAIGYNGGLLRDSDDDGVADFRDLDSDNDGLYDVKESSGNDPDNDGLLGNGTPGVNGDGEVTGSGLIPPDTDGDAVTDQLDLDSDNDGLSDVIEAGGSDPDGDGVTGSGVPRVDPNTGVPLMGGGLLALLDSDSDGTPDVLDSTDSSAGEQPLQTGLNGVGGCSLSGAGEVDPLLPLLVILALAYLGMGLHNYKANM